ncbi:hypothetical protein HYC85_021028 [Camellia sinensis]|uniref:Uncharacterized protein n=1 Tax=Camellia sinensis TaxID=4442 RepID=A0A7J7GIU4_CAMSI|nr:hypothetical protein HYC85_021028 [Camellia sinensis]
MRYIHAPLFETLILESDPLSLLSYTHTSLFLSLSDKEDEGEYSRKKLRLSKDQSTVLEESFKEHKLYRLFKSDFEAISKIQIDFEIQSDSKLRRHRHLHQRGSLFKEREEEELTSYMKAPVSDIPWGNLCNLITLDLAKNQINGDINELIGGLVECINNSLEELWLEYNQVRGQLPDYSLAHLQNSRHLVISSNLISGPIPKSVGRLSKLEALDVSFNQMNGSIRQGVGKLANLNFLSLDNNYWEGALSQNHLQGLTKLQSFRISSSNKSLIFNMSHEWVPPFSLTDITVRNCRLDPRFLAWPSNQKQLSSIRLADVAISETITYWLWELSPQIFWLDLSGNWIHGVLPNSLVFSRAYLVDLSFKRLEGSLPVWPNVSHLLLANNLFSRSIPMNIDQMMLSLKALDLFGNFLNGSFSLSIGGGGSPSSSVVPPMSFPPSNSESIPQSSAPKLEALKSVTLLI